VFHRDPLVQTGLESRRGNSSGVIKKVFDQSPPIKAEHDDIYRTDRGTTREETRKNIPISFLRGRIGHRAGFRLD
jgi:hypothetical protein